ncbi:MAG: selenocysteine-specific translation elongation factor [Rhodovulum sulfidophilum]|uniref:Selenocysteine-specific elongation factor n=1 Tax=Rhodovulum sulfidophilum TaxID=35806 RepID=A0A2W5N4F5_RHOSU|nr:MAG: selenocysteine-specific translation elongation factor [Rhodovulum sulfidophilum]
MIIGTAGHIDHGKTALVKALTGIDADRLAEEKARGITIDLGFAYARLGSELGPEEAGITGFVDVPGHEKFVHTMLAGAGGIDFALLVVAADDGVMPQTTEHLAILDLLGVARGAVALTKADLAEPARIAAVTEEITALLAPTTLAGAPVFLVSAPTGAGIPALRAHLAAAERATGARAATGRARLAVDRAFTLTGAGTIVTGTMISGAMAVGDRVVVSPSGRPARIRSLHAQNTPAERGLAGQRCALNLAGDGITRDAVARGDLVLDPALHAPTDRIDARLRVLASEPKPLGTWFPARLHCGSTEIGARVVPLGAPIGPGETGLAQLVLDRPVAAVVGDRFILRDVSARRTIGGGRFLDLRAPARKRRTEARLAFLAAAAAPEPAAALRGMLATGPVDARAFARDRALTEAERAEAIRGAGAERIGAILVAAGGTGALRAALVATLAAYHLENPELQGMARERLRLAAPTRLAKEDFLDFLHGEAAAGHLRLEGAFVRLPGHEARLTPADEALFDRIAAEIGGAARFRPPRVRDLATAWGVEEGEIRRVLKLCARAGRVDEIAKDHFFPRATTAEMAGFARDLSAAAPEGWFAAAAFRDRMDNGRKVAIQILDFFDRAGLTLRRGDLRRINPHRADLFGPGPEDHGGESSPVGRPDFKSGWGGETVPGGFDSHSPSPAR